MEGSLRRVTGSYRLSPDVNELLHAKLIHLIARGDVVIGHYGRRGYLSGVLIERTLTAAFRDNVSQGNLTIMFDDKFTRFEGRVLSKQSGDCPCSGTRLPRSRAAAGAQKRTATSPR
jgi:hypothetical protein